MTSLIQELQTRLQAMLAWVFSVLDGLKPQFILNREYEAQLRTTTMALEALAEFERFIVRSPEERARYWGFPPEGWMIADASADERARFIRMVEEGLPRNDLMSFDSTKWHLIHELRLAEVWGINSALRQKLLSIGLDQAKTVDHYSELRSQPEIKVAFV